MGLNLTRTRLQTNIGNSSLQQIPSKLLGTLGKIYTDRKGKEKPFSEEQKQAKRWTKTTFKIVDPSSDCESEIEEPISASRKKIWLQS